MSITVNFVRFKCDNVTITIRNTNHIEIPQKLVSVRDDIIYDGPIFSTECPQEIAELKSISLDWKRVGLLRISERKKARFQIETGVMNSNGETEIISPLLFIVFVSKLYIDMVPDRGAYSYFVRFILSPTISEDMNAYLLSNGRLVIRLTDVPKDAVYKLNMPPGFFYGQTISSNYMMPPGPKTIEGILTNKSEYSVPIEVALPQLDIVFKGIVYTHTLSDPRTLNFFKVDEFEGIGSVDVNSFGLLGNGKVTVYVGYDQSDLERNNVLSVAFCWKHLLQ